MIRGVGRRESCRAQGNPSDEGYSQACRGGRAAWRFRPCGAGGGAVAGGVLREPGTSGAGGELLVLPRRPGAWGAPGHLAGDAARGRRVGARHRSRRSRREPADPRRAARDRGAGDAVRDGAARREGDRGARGVDSHGRAVAGPGRRGGSGGGGIRARGPRRDGRGRGEAVRERPPLRGPRTSDPRTELLHLSRGRRAGRAPARFAGADARGRRPGARDRAGRSRPKPPRRRAAARARGSADAVRGQQAARRRDRGRRGLDRRGGGMGGNRRAHRPAPAGRHRRGACLLVVPAPRLARRTGAPADRLGTGRHRPLRAGRAGGEGARTRGARQPAAAHPAGHLRPHRAASGTGGGRDLRERPVAGRFRRGRGAAAGVTALRRTLGAPLARRHPVRRGRHPGAGA